MKNQIELNFLQSLLEKFELNFYVVSERTQDFPEMDIGLRRQIFLEPFSKDRCMRTFSEMESKTIYIIEDEFLCRYIFMRISEGDPAADEVPFYLVIGPYLNEQLTNANLHELLASIKVSPAYYNQFDKYYSNLTIISDSTLLKMVNTYAECLWGSFDNFNLQVLSYHLKDFELVKISENSQASGNQDAFLRIQSIEEMYARENRLMQMVSQGQVNRVSMLMDNKYAFEQRLPDKVRNMKNYTIIFNTLLRKAAESGYVPTYHIDRLSSKYSQKIEATNTVEELYALQKEMARAYCMLVKNYSMKDYSLLVRRALTYIDLDLTADLSLKAVASQLNVNASYLSTLFRKETNTTFTDYVNHKRIDQAIFLLNTTDMQIQTIAEYCGIPDVNYFTKTFKKYVGKTPTEYRKTIHHF